MPAWWPAWPTASLDEADVARVLWRLHVTRPEALEHAHRRVHWPPQEQLETAWTRPADGPWTVEDDRLARAHVDDWPLEALSPDVVNEVVARLLYQRQCLARLARGIYPRAMNGEALE